MKTVFSILTSCPLREDDNGQNLNATIALIQTSGEMSDYYAYYLAVAMGLPDLGVENPSAPQTDPVVPPAPDAPETPENPEDPNNPESPQTPTEEPRLTILKALLERQFGIPAEALDRIDWDKINLNELDLSDPAKAAQTLYNEVMEQLFGEFPDVPDIPDVPDVPVVPEEPPDMRYFITVVLTYNENILTTELPREGMDPAGFVPELGLEPEAEVER